MNANLKRMMNAKYGIVQMCNVAAEKAAYWYAEAQKNLSDGELVSASTAQLYARNVADEALRLRIKIVARTHESDTVFADRLYRASVDELGSTTEQMRQ